MAPIALVSEQIEAGGKLIAQLTQDGFPITAASWINESDGGQWYLYLASPTLDGRGLREGYRRVGAALEKMQLPFSLDTGEIKLLGAADSLARAIAAVRDRVSGERGTWSHGGSLGELAIDAAYVYPPVTLSSRADAKHGVA